MLSRLRADQLFRGLNSSARKVFEAVPIGEAWPRHQVDAELRRQGSNQGMGIVMGCLAKLVEIGLVVEPSPGNFQRAPLREQAVRQEPQPQQEPSMAGPIASPVLQLAAQQAQQPAKAPAADTLGLLAGELSTMAKRLGEIASDLEDVALAFEEQLGKDSAELTQLRQLQQVLRKSLGA